MLKTDIWENLLGRLKKVAYQQKAYGCVTLDVRLVIDQGELLIWREPQVTRYAPYGTSPTEAIMGVLADSVNDQDVL